MIEVIKVAVCSDVIGGGCCMNCCANSPGKCSIAMSPDSLHSFATCKHLVCGWVDFYVDRRPIAFQSNLIDEYQLSFSNCSANVATGSASVNHCFDVQVHFDS